MSITIRPTKHLVRVYELLLRTYGEPKNEPDYDPLGGLVGTILSQHTSDINSDRAYKHLIVTIRTWEDVRDAPDRKSTRLNSSHQIISYAVFCLKKKKRYQSDRGVWITYRPDVEERRLH